MKKYSFHHFVNLDTNKWYSYYITHFYNLNKYLVMGCKKIIVLIENEIARAHD